MRGAPDAGLLQEELEAAEDRIAELEAALWIALGHAEVVIREGTPHSIEWTTMEDGGRMARRGR
jgi:hypothetical protein